MELATIINFFKEYKPNYIVHLAAVSHANRSNKNPYNTFDHSFRTLENVLDAGRKTVEKLIYLSSSMVYGNFKENTVTEESPCNPIGIYGALKLSGEYLVKAYNQVFDLPYVILRPSALYGERCISRRVSQIFIENALSGNPISIEGDGDEKLDFTYIKDLIEGIGLCIFNEKSNNNTFNLTHGNARPINLLVDILKKNFTDLKVISQKRDKLMPVRGTLSIDKARDILGYVPRWPLEQGYQEYINWYSNLYKKFNLK